MVQPSSFAAVDHVVIIYLPIDLSYFALTLPYAARSAKPESERQARVQGGRLTSARAWIASQLSH